MGGCRGGGGLEKDFFKYVSKFKINSGGRGGKG